MAGTNAQIEQVYYELAQFKPGAKELVERFVRQGIRCTVASSTDRYCIEAGLKRLGILDLFDGIFSAGELNTTKESPRIFYTAMECMGTEKESTWVFEDGLYAIRTASAAGFRTVGVYDLMSEADQPEIMQCADYYYTSLEDFHIV
jgi:HAD superfamily hydrolase (TIGR01509 family)